MNRQLAVLLAVAMLALTQTAGGAEQFTQQLGAEALNPRLMKQIGPPKAFKKSPAGLTVTLPAEGTQAGVETKFSVSGDFEVTAAYELLNVPQPDAGYGAGVILRLNKADSEDFASLGRRTQRDGKQVFNANHSKLVSGQRQHDQTFHEAQSQRGELRVIRTDGTLRFLVKEEGSDEFRQLREIEFGKAPLKSIKFLGDTGGSRQEMTVRLTRLSIRADGLPYGPTTVPGQYVWTTWKVLGAAGVLVLIGGGIWYWRKRAEW
jgi:hypothetical protein